MTLVSLGAGEKPAVARGLGDTVDSTKIVVGEGVANVNVEGAVVDTAVGSWVTMAELGGAVSVTWAIVVTGRVVVGRVGEGVGDGMGGSMDVIGGTGVGAGGNAR